VDGGIAAALCDEEIAIGIGEVDGRRGEEKDLTGFEGADVAVVRGGAAG
jgi:hypothetical protein